jgi:hypothetical protein
MDRLTGFGGQAYVLGRAMIVFAYLQSLLLLVLSTSTKTMVASMNLSASSKNE